LEVDLTNISVYSNLNCGLTAGQSRDTNCQDDRIMEYIAVVRRGMSTGYKTVEGHNSWVASRGTLLTLARRVKRLAI
jgi:hypothetical protein